MIRKLSPLFLLGFLAACGGANNQTQRVVYNAEGQKTIQQGPVYNDRVPDFAIRNYEPFTRQETVALALREWRLFNQPIADYDPLQHPEPTSPDFKAERAPGLWQRIGEYWWVGMDPSMKEASYTGKHNSNGTVFDFRTDGHYAWSAAFISYIMRIAGANDRFPYSPNHATYINASASGTSPILRAQDPASYAPQLGDLICTARGKNRNSIRFSSLPTGYMFPAHCGIVVNTNQNAEPFGHQLSIIGGNVDDSVALTHVPTDVTGKIASPEGASYDSRYPWCVVIQVLYEADTTPPSDR
ncbi:DUF2272 domain-containing protein [Commensalibacter oyaizuii]|uniref:DUF2272 domain-containing protein n=1 Tax=Commensalibacter oyaizuii TaxID=3043873 RepID=A0ABT6Q1F9_9PROT|nr:DUF2272 domain-containing protein [Commensalibacter sp. TBRC 16381]MDI2090951.1 DUF2272 domain-containing protein [Commensalibacter sp. TBRC 16381]